MIELKLGLIKIPLMLINTTNSRYATSGLNQFSGCCQARVRQKKICEECNRELRADEIFKGKGDVILTREQEKELKEFEEGGYLNVLGIKDTDETTLYDLAPYIIKSQYVLPSIRKGFKRTDLKTFYSFKEALKNSNKHCLVKLVQRGVEHIGVLINYKEELVFFEIPFARYINEDIIRLREALERETKGLNLTEFEKEATKFISQFKPIELSQIKEEKLELLKLFLERKSVIAPASKQSIAERESNPFLL